MWTLTNCLRHVKDIPWVVLKNGKRDLSNFEESQTSIGVPQLEESTSAMQASPSRPPELHSPPFSPKEDVTMSIMVMCEMNMKKEIWNIKLSLSSISQAPGSDTALRQKVASSYMSECIKYYQQ